MAVNTLVSDNGQDLTIKIDGRFDFSVHKEFRQAYEQGGPTGKFVLDMRHAEYMDSSALGMLLLLREYAGGEHAHVELTNCTGAIHKILTTANFDKLFHLT